MASSDPGSSRAALLPNANNPRLLLRVIRLIASGVRRPRSIAEILEIELRTVHYYTQASEWLGFLKPDQQGVLTQAGLSWVFSGEDERSRVYAHAVWSNAFASQLMGTFGGLPSSDGITGFIRAWDASVSESTARRRASAIRGLLEPALQHYPSPDRPAEPQLAIPFTPARPPLHQPPVPVDLRAGTSESPDLYRHLLCVLLDAGELRPGGIRAILDDLGGSDAPLSRYIEMALRRGDATRSGEHLVVTPGAIRRRALADDVLLVALSDPDYRRALESPPDSRARRRFTTWDVRLFGAPPTPESVAAALMGRRLESIPIALPSGIARTPAAPRRFLEAIQSSAPIVCFPDSLRQLSGQVSLINALLRSARKAPAGVRLPAVIDERGVVHGGLLAPGERLMLGIPDNLTLRLRALSCCPAIALLAALLLLDRRQSSRLSITRGRRASTVLLAGQVLGTVLSVISDFCTASGWELSRPPDGRGLTDLELLDIAAELGMLSQIGARRILSESLFVQLQADPESRAVYELLLPLERRLSTWMEAKRVTDSVLT
ncbi:MAG: hypothetical protein P8R54_02600 [Myxococcota bacterium]|nr:hypothetical protein [Myxococcota bacterium]